MLGAAAAQRLGIDRIYAGERIWLGGQWFYVAGILSSAVLAPEIDSSVLVGFPAAETLPRLRRPPDHDLRPQRDQPGRRRPERARARPPTPKRPTRSTSASPRTPSPHAPTPQGALNGLFLGLGAVSLLVGAIGVANIMLISVLERRSEIGLRRALGATKGHIRTQFLSEAILLALLGGAVGVTLGILATADLRPHQALDDRHPDPRLGRRTRRRHRNRRHRRPASRHPRRPALTDRRAANPLTTRLHPANRHGSGETLARPGDHPFLLKLCARSLPSPEPAVEHLTKPREHRAPFG